jgi:succinoglycan biosynthesis transport protein ExoP
MRRDRAPSTSAAPIEAADGELDLRALGIALWHKKRWIILPTAVAALIAFLAVNMITPRYRSEARVLIENQETAYNRPEADKGGDRNPTLVDPEAVQSQVQLIQSRDLARKVVYGLKLNELKEFNSESAPKIILNAVLSLVGMGRDPSKASVEERALERFTERLSVYAIEKSRVIVIDFQSENPELAAKVANTVADEYLAVQRATKAAATRQTSQWLAAEIDSLRGRVVEAEARVEQFRAKSNLYVGNNNNQLGTQTLGELNTQIVTARTQKSDSEARARLIREMLRSGRPLEVSDILNSDLMRRLSEQRAALRAQLAEQSSTLLPLHPRIKELNAQITNLDAQIRSEADKLARAFENDTQVANAKLENLLASLEQMKSQQAKLGGEDVQLRALEREAKAQRDLLETYLVRYRDATARETPGAVPADARVISQAVANTTAYFPKKLPIVAVVSLGAAMLMTVFLVMGELLSGEVYRSERPVTPRVVPEPEPVPEPETVPVPVNLAANTKPAQYRLAELLAYMRNLGPGIFVVSRAKKATMSGRIAVHLARDLAATGARVVLLDMDPETSPSAALVMSPRAQGLSDLLAKAAGFSEVIQRESASNLHVIPHGYGVGDSTQLLSADRLSIVLGALAQTYEYVIVAAPALAGVLGAPRLAKFARATAVIATEGDEEAGERQAAVLKDEQFANVVVIPTGQETPGGFSGRFAA